MMWKSDKQLMEESLNKAYALREPEVDDRFGRLIRLIREQDERLKRDSRSRQAA